MRKKLVWSVPVLLVVLIVLSPFFFWNGRKNSVAILKDYEICFNDSPQAVAARIPWTCVEREKLNYTDKTVYTYEMEFWGMPATARFYFRQDKSLTEMSITIPGSGREQADALFERAREIIQAAYREEASFVCEDIVNYDENTYYQSMGLKDGPAETSYTIEVKGNYLYVSCEDLR